MIPAGKHALFRPRPREQSMSQRRGPEHSRSGDDDFACESVQLRGVEDVVGKLDHLGAGLERRAADLAVTHAHTPMRNLAFLLQLEERVGSSSSEEHVLSGVVKKVDVDPVLLKTQPRPVYRAPQILAVEGVS